MGVPLAGRWFERRTIDDRVTLLWEPHVVPLMRCDIWHVRGRDRDLVIDTGMGVASLVEAAQDLLDKSVTAVATHSHDDHIGSHHEFDDCIADPLEAPLLAHPSLASLSPTGAWGAEAVAKIKEPGPKSFLREDQTRHATEPGGRSGVPCVSPWSSTDAW